MTGASVVGDYGQDGVLRKPFDLADVEEVALESTKVGKKMGHAAAMIGSYAEGWAAKVAALDRAGVVIARDLDGLAAAAKSALTRAMAPAA